MISSTRYVDGTPTSEVTPITVRYIHPPHHGFQKIMAMNDHRTLGGPEPRAPDPPFWPGTPAAKTQEAHGSPDNFLGPAGSFVLGPTLDLTGDLW